ncbi:DUF4055 domain-containing protein [Nitrospinae bacterium]|nr:DUF4055 domain-containing protein [Nitrospinota bacterium]
MGIDSTHPLYDDSKDKWTRVRDSYLGSDAIKSKGEIYLPKLSSQEKAEYDAYVMRSMYVNAIKNTVQGLVGAVMRINPVINAPDRIMELAQDITGTGVSLNDFISNMLSEQLLMGRQGVMIDRTTERAYLSGYTTEQMTNWMEDVIVLKETYLQQDLNDNYSQSYEVQYRELLIDEDGKFLVRLWRDNEGWSISQEIYPTRVGQALEEIPFVAISGNELNLNPTQPPLMSLVDTNLSMYRTSADLEHGRHFTALPTPYVTGIDGDSELRIGSGSAWILPDSSSRAGYLEFTGQGLQALEKAVEEKRSIMAGLGASLLQTQKNGVESAESLRLRQNSEASVLVGAVLSVQEGIAKALSIMAEWEGVSGDIEVELNTDFVDTKILPEELTALMGAWQSGAISHETFLHNMKKGEILPVEVTVEDEKDRIDLQNPMNLD